ncbi:hypothetical protein KAF86_07675, partial [Klebsiella pneumoniae]|nr:hypothetical protein [Klebsiella pneumoniae]
MGIENGNSSVQQDVPATDNDVRHEVIVTGCVTKYGRGIHFCNDELLSGAKEGANKRGNSSRLTQSFHFFMFE